MSLRSLHPIREILPPEGKQLSNADRLRATQLKAEHIRQLAHEAGCSISVEDAERVAQRPDVSEPAALAAYGAGLLCRMRGEEVGPELLVLRREFAWLSTGSPKKGFKLSAEQILLAEEHLTLVVRERSGGN